MTKKQRQFFFDLGKQDFKHHVPRMAYKSKELFQHLYQDGISQGKIVNKEHLDFDNEAMAEWAKGWDHANLLSPLPCSRF